MSELPEWAVGMARAVLENQTTSPVTLVAQALLAVRDQAAQRLDRGAVALRRKADEWDGLREENRAVPVDPADVNAKSRRGAADALDMLAAEIRALPAPGPR